MDQSRQILETRTGLVAYGLQPFLTQSGTPSSTPQLQAAVRELSARALARVTVIAPDGRILADSAVPDHLLATLENHRTRPEIQQAIATGHGTDLLTNHATGERTLYVAIGLNGPNQTTPTVFLRLGLPMTTFDRDVSVLHQDLALAFGIAFIMAVALSVWLARSITKPLSEIASAAQQLAKGDHAVRIRTGSRDEVGLLADTFNDMTDQLKTTIDELSEDRSQLLAMLTSMVEGVMVLDRRGRVLQINPALERMFDVTRMEARGHPCSDVFRHPQLDKLVSTVLTKRLNEEDEILLHPSGRRLHIDASVTESNRENDASVILVFHDMTELRRLELIRKDFVANVSHELRTPLASLKGYVETLQSSAKDDAAARERFLKIMGEQAERMSRLVDDLLSLSRVEMREYLPLSDEVELGVVLTEVAQTLEPLAKRAGVTLTLSRGDAEAMVRGDRDELMQVFQNLVQNAVKYGRSNGKVEIRMMREPAASGRPEGFRVDVVDDGPGIAPQHLPRLTERFYRVNVAASREKGGTGLGLAIVKHILNRHRGELVITSKVGHGSTFSVLLPSAPT
ncbi:MAG: phosphate regulon sensor histidine kinase PhoR [Rhodospirillales bacterium]|nr:phosphate regulon sensor histidine kinase PhoR [Rhodospirillales bacterium]